MGFFDKLFGGKAASETKFSGQKMTVMLPIDGKVIPLEQLPDETFCLCDPGPRLRRGAHRRHRLCSL